MAAQGNKKIIDTREPIIKQKKFLKRLYIFLGIGCLVYYVFPFIIYLAFATEETLEEYTQIMRMVLMGMNPLYVFMASFSTCGYADKKALVPLIYAAYYVPGALVLLGPTSLIYSVMYVGIGYFGMISHQLTINRVKKSKKKRYMKENGKKQETKKVSKRGR